MSNHETAVTSFSTLDDVIKNLITLVNVSKQSSYDSVNAFIASIALLKELKKDQAALHRLRKEQGDNATFPSPSEIPAISAVIQNPILFRCLLSCLLTSSGTSFDTQEAGQLTTHYPHHHHSHHHTNPGNSTRKRSLSAVSDVPIDRANKALKSTHSPIPNVRNKLQIQDVSRKVPGFNTHVLAATIFYSAFQYVDHWPEQLVRAYAEDSFGPRLWVDDERCSQFVANLALSHDENLVLNDEEDKTKIEDAAKIAEFYRIMEEQGLRFLDNENDSPDRSKKRSSQLLRSTTSDLEIKSQQSSISDALSSEANTKDFRKSQMASSSSLKSFEDENSVVSGDGSLSSATRKSIPKNGTAYKSRDPESNEVSMDIDVVNSVSPRKLSLFGKRQRYFGINLSLAHESISSSLRSRLEQKSKQNSGLLQSLPAFTSIPSVRFMIAENLEQWLKSPALAGLARALFVSTVTHMKNTDPPLLEDLRAIECILAMKLKANQLNAHIENVTAIARQIPVQAVAHHMYSTLLGEAIKSGQLDDMNSISELRMVCAIHKEINPLFSYDALAAVLLTLLVSNVVPDGKAQKISRSERHHLVKKLRSLIRALAGELGPNFDGCQLIAALLSLDVSTESWSTKDEEDKARLMFQCAILASDLVKKESDGSIAALSRAQFRQSLTKSRKLLLTWYCQDFGPRMKNNTKKTNVSQEEENMIVGAGVPDFNSALVQTSDDVVPSWVRTMRCLLFLEDGDSPLVKQFLEPDPNVLETEWNEEAARVKLCFTFGGAVNDDLIWIILKSASRTEGGIDPSTAISILENLFENCSRDRKGVLKVNDPMIIWELYKLVQFKPTKVASISGATNGKDANKAALKNIPTLAYPGLWWRVTMLALILCGSSPKNIGAVVWNDHPTLRALMKMITSSRFRFPTVDCDEEVKIKVKNDEQTARDEEAKLAEFLFLPDEQEKKKEDNKGSRISRRILKQQQEKEAASKLAESIHRKKMLKTAQKSIMLWDPDGPARKPPRESVDLLLSVEEAFGLAEIFQGSTDPDFLLMTIGQTTRGAIERAYDWLIPIISTVPTTITRLPSSASCFLLLRAYGTEGDERKQLKQLATPLLVHVRDSLHGKYGEGDSVKAVDLLMTDVASSKTDRRRCARRVLQDALEPDDNVETPRHSWMQKILRLTFARSLLLGVVKHLYTAAAYERGKVLRSILMALEDHYRFAKRNEIELGLSFPERITELISSRPGVCAEAMSSYPDLWNMITRVICTEFRLSLKVAVEDSLESQNNIVMRVPSSDTKTSEEIKISLSLLQSICVCLSVWKQNDESEETELYRDVYNLTASLLKDEGSDEGENFGLSTARFANGNTGAVSVESWIILAKSRSDFTARRAALSAPLNFLPRLLLCSGLPMSSLLTMIDRLGKLGETAEDKEKAYLEILAPKASSEWDIGRIGRRKEVSRKLLGRLSAYMRLNENILKDDKINPSKTFLLWLSNECVNHQVTKDKKRKPKKDKESVSESLVSVVTSSSILSSLTNEFRLSGSSMLKKNAEMNDFMQQQEDESHDQFGGTEYISRAKSLIEDSKHVELDLYLGELFENIEYSIFKTTSSERLDVSSLCGACLDSLVLTSNQHEGLVVVILKWVPCFSRYGEQSPELWKRIFSYHHDYFWSVTLNRLATKCVSVWTKTQSVGCAEWILSEYGPNSSVLLDLQRVTDFLVATSDQASPQTENLTTTAIFGEEWKKTKDLVTSAVVIAMQCFTKLDKSDLLARIKLRNNLPSALTLLFIVAKFGRTQLHVVVEVILKTKSESSDTILRAAYDIILLRLYLIQPYAMDLGSSDIRNALLSASEESALSWIHWRCNIDDVVSDLITVYFSGELRIAKALSDVARRHPLLMLRRLPTIASALELDATCTNVDGEEARGFVVGQEMDGPREAVFDGRSVKVSIQHWGYMFTEPTWTTMLDILSVIPREVLFTCGTKVGLHEFLNIYVQLISVQLDLLTATKVSRLKGKLNDCFTVFQLSNATGWKNWLGTNIGGTVTTVREILTSTGFLSAQQAIDSRKDAT